MVRGTGPHLLFMGDSVAHSLVPGLEALARAEGLTLSVAVMDGCPWQRDRDAFVPPEVQARCRERRDAVYDRVIPELRPDVLVLH